MAQSEEVGRRNHRGWMSKAAVLGAPAAAFLAAPSAQADVLVHSTLGATLWGGGNPAVASTTVGEARLMGQASMTLVFDSVGMVGPSVVVDIGYIGAGTVTGVVLTGYGTTLPADTAGWALTLSNSLSLAIGGPYTLPQYYLGFRVDFSGSASQHVWVGIDPEFGGAALTGYGAMSAASGGGGGGSDGGGPGGAAGTPEPAAAGLALLALGAAGILRHKRREQVA